MIKTLTLMIIGLVTVPLLLSGCSETELAQQTERVLSVKTQTIDAGDREIVAGYTGSLEGERQAMLYAKLAESVDSVWVQQGDGVVAGQVVLSLDRNGPTSSYREVRSTSLNAEKTFHKMEYLFEEGAISESDYDAAKTNYEVSKAAFDAVTRLVEIQTPIGGIVTAIDVLPGDFVYVGQKLATVATSDRLRIRFGVNTEDIKSFKIGEKVRVKSDLISGTGEGVVTVIASSADPMTRTFEVTALIDNRDRLFNPGMFVHLEYLKARLENVIAVPRGAVLTLDGQTSVFTVADGRASMRSVKLGAELSGEVVVESGLQSGDTLVVLGQEYLDEGMRVKITDLNGTAP